MGRHDCHIERLPEDILLHILQSLPLVDAVATRALSRMWKKLWEKSCSQRSNLCFDVDNLIALDIMPDGGSPRDYPYLNYRKNVKLRHWHYSGISGKVIEDFIKGVDMIVQCRRGEEQDALSQGVNSLEIRFPLRREHSKSIDNWLSSTVTSTTKQLILVLDLVLELSYSETDPGFYKFPFELLINQKCSSLEHLQLEFISAKLPQNFDGFATLRSLELNHTEMTQEDVHKLLMNCPLLEFLTIEKCLNLVSLQVSSPLPHLKVLILEGCYKLTRIELWAENLCSFEYDMAESLEYLTFRGCHNPVKVAACDLHYIDDYLRPLSKDFPFVNTLYLCSCLENLSVVLRDNIFAHLKILALFLKINKDEKNLKHLSSLLNDVAPLLEELELHVDKNYSANCYKTNNKEMEGDQYNHLKRVSFTGFTGETGQTMLARYFLIKARRLQVLTIDTRARFYRNFEAIERRRFPREINRRCRNAYKFLCNEAPEKVKLILVRD